MKNATLVGHQVKSLCLNEISRLVALSGYTREMELAALVATLAGLHSHSDDYLGSDSAKDTLDQLAALELWRGNLFLREALLAMVQSTTLHPASLNMCFLLIQRSMAETLGAIRQGARCFPQEERLMRQAESEARRIIGFSLPCELIRDGRTKKFRSILKDWQQDDTCGRFAQFLLDHWSDDQGKFKKILEGEY